MRASIHTVAVAIAAVILVFATAPTAPAASFLWKKQLGTTGDDYVRFLRGDAAGNVIIAYQYTLANPVPIPGGYTTVGYAIIKYDPNGKQLWRKNLRIGEIYGLDVDDFGDIYAEIQLNNAVIVKYGADGTMAWQREVDRVPALFAVDKAGHPVVVIVECSECSEIDVNYYDTDGSIAWSKKAILPNTTRFEIDGVTTDADSNIVVSGITTGTTPQDYYDDKVWVAKFTNGGVLSFFNVFDDVSLASISNVYVNGVATDESDNIVLAGFAAIDLTGQPARCGAAICAFVAKFDPDGAPIWTRVVRFRPQHLNYTDSQADAVTIGPAGEIVVAGLRDVLNSQTSQLYARPWVAAFAADGSQLWNWYWPFGASYDFVSWPTAGVTVDALGDVAFGGWTNGPLAGTWKGYADAFVAKLKP